MTPSEWIVAAAVAQFHDQLTVPPLTSVLSALHGWFASCGADGPRANGGSAMAGRGLSELGHSVRLIVMPLGPTCTAGSSCIPGGKCVTPGTSTVNSHLPTLI
jgi:hypothetical protein